MSISQATIDLLFKAQNLTAGAVGDVVSTVGKVGTAGAAAASKFAGAFAGMGDKLANGIGNAVETLSSGGSVGEAAIGFGVYMAGQMAESMAGHLLERLAESSLLAAVAAPLSALGTAMGGLMAAAVPIGIAALPFILIGALVAAIAVLIVNPEIRGKVIDFVAGLVGKIGDALRTGLGILADIIPKAFGAAWSFVVENVPKVIGRLVDLWLKLPSMLLGLGGDILRTIIGGLASLPGAVARIIGDAFSSLHLDIGPFHISASGVRVDLPNIDLPHFAAGVRGFGGGLAVVGEKGPEIVRLPRGADVFPNGQAPSSSGSQVAGVTIQGITERELVDMVERGMFFRLRRAGTAP